jgi:NAD(P)-dependent dehydrogenase (short-subunit alcohol dehydrogenase family)
MAGMLEDRVAVVTGGARGNGEAIGKVFAAEGARVYLWDILEEVRETEQRLAQGGAGVLGMQVDISEGAQVERAVGEVLNQSGGIDILVNNAAIAPEVPFVEMTEDQRRRVWAVNVDGAMRCTRAVLPGMIERGRGKIVIISSVTGPLSAIPGLTMYAATKGALLGFTRNLALELAPHNINVNAILPGTIDTPLMRQSFGFDGPDGDEQLADFGKKYFPWGRVGRAEEIATVAAFLASDWASYITGTEIVVDGGNRLTEWVEH